MELSTTSTLLLGVIPMLILVASLHLKSRTKSEKRRPPGPRCLPFIGSLQHLLTSQPQATLRDLAKKHGPVMYLKLGQVDTVVISSAAAAREMYRDKDLSFASRPKLLGAEIICYGSLDIAYAPYGDYWRALRKLCKLQLFSASKVKQFASIRDKETMSLIKEIYTTSGKIINLSSMLVSTSNSITGIAAFGQRCNNELKEHFLLAMNVVVSNVSWFCIWDLFPSLQFLDVITGTKRRLRRAHLQLEDVTDKIIAKCEARRTERKANNSLGQEAQVEDDLLSVLLKVRDEDDFEIPIKITTIKAIIQDLFIAGTETTSSTAEWIMAELVRNPDAMAKAQKEVRQAFDHKSSDEHESLMGQLHYTRMVIKETLRLHPPLPLLLPRLCRETCDIGGFEVNEGTRVIVNAWAMARSSEYWEKANEFRPERFENSMADYKGTQFEYMPFGSGRRLCPGISFAVSSLELITARLLYYFNWSLPQGMQPEELDMDTTVGAAARRTNQLHLVASPNKVPNLLPFYINMRRCLLRVFFLLVVQR